MDNVPLTERLALSISEAVAITGCCRDAIYLAIQSGHLAAKKRGKSTLITPAALRDWIASLPDYPIESKATPPAPAPEPAPRVVKRKLTQRLQVTA
jgi:hypothetical protein